jgi:hypothetical protein
MRKRKLKVLVPARGRIAIVLDAPSGTVILSFAQLAEHFGVTVKTVCRWRDKGMPCAIIKVFGLNVSVVSLQAASRWVEAYQKAHPPHRPPK